MSHTTNDLRERLAHDLADFGTLPTVAPQALAQGRRTIRRQQAVAGLVGVTTAAIAAGTLSVHSSQDATPVDPGPTPASNSSNSSSSPTPEDPITQGREMPRSDEWNQHVVDTVGDLLPERFNDVQIHEDYRAGGLPLFRVSSSTQNLEFYILLGHGFPQGYGEGSCDKPPWWMTSCLVVDLPSPLAGRVFHQRVGAADDDQNVSHHAAGSELSGPGLDATLVITPIGADVPIELTDEELSSITTDPAYLTLIEEGATIFAP